MICLKAIKGFTEQQTHIDEIFADLHRAESAAERQELVLTALRFGVSQYEIREMLDYLESFGKKSSSARATSRNIRPKTSNNGSWTSFFCGLIYR